MVKNTRHHEFTAIANVARNALLATCALSSVLFAQETGGGLDAGQRLNWKVSLAVPMPGLLVGVGAAVLILLTLLLYLKILRAFPRKRAVTLIVLRTLALIALFLSALQPTVSHDLVSPRRIEMIALVDTSRSMTRSDMTPQLLPLVKEENEPGTSTITRADAVGRSFKHSAWLDALSERFNVNLFSFDSLAVPARRGDLLQPVAEGEFTDIGAALKAAVRRTEGEIQGAILITDGADNGRQPLSAVADEIGLPLYLIGVGDPGPGDAEQSGKELAVASVEYNKRVRLNETASIRVNVYHRGIEGEISAELRFGESSLDAQKVALSTESKNDWVTLKFTPGTEGVFTYHVVLPSVPGEQTVINNTRKITIEVHREETRVLYLAGEPSFDYKFVKQLLSEDPSFTFTGLVRFGDKRVFRHGKWDDARIDFSTFHVVLLHNLPADFLRTEDLERLRKQVDEEGLGLIVLGGNNAFNASKYENTALSQMLPMDLVASPVVYSDEPFQLSLSAEGTEHPIFSFLSEPDKNAEFWRELPKTHGFNEGFSPKPGASVLAGTDATGQSMPLLMVQKYGKGRVVAFGARYTWPWRATDAGRSGFERFWSQAFRWVANRDEMQIKEGERLRFWTDRDDYSAGDEVRLEARLINERGKLTSTATLIANVHTPTNEVLPVGMTSQDELGRYMGTFAVTETGQYAVEVVAKQDEFLFGTAKSSFTVGSTLAELDQAEMNETLLMSIASRTGGAYFSIKEIDKLPSAVPSGKQTELRKVSEEVWSHPYFLLLFLALVTTEWILRKRFHMV